MDDRFSAFAVAVAAGVIVMGGIVWLLVGAMDTGEETVATTPVGRSGPRVTAHEDAPRRPMNPGARDALDAMADYAALAELNRLLNDPNAIRGEALLRFASDDALARFKNAAARSGVRVLGELGRLKALRVGFDEIGQLSNALGELGSDDYDSYANYPVSVPSIPDPENPGTPVVPFGQRTLEFLGITTDNSSWGQGVKVAVIDTGVAEHSAFADGQVRNVQFLDGQTAGTEGGDDFGHGTAVASIIGSNDENALGVAPASEILSFAIADETGSSNSFALAEAIFAAADQGVDVMNISLGSYGDSLFVRDAVNYALEQGVLIVASSGNQGLDRLAYPAAYEGVIAVGAVDSLGQQVYYSNGGDTLGLTAPGVGVLAAYPSESGDDIVTFSGTSASAPYVTGAIAAVLSVEPDLSPAQAQALLYEYANEAGQAGPDAQYGNGILNVGRVLERNTRGIYDVAVSSQTFGDPTVPSNNSNPMIDIALQNQGTETLYNVQVRVNSSGMVHNFQIPKLEPTQVAVEQAPVNSLQVRADGSVQILSTATTANGVQDRNLRNNQQTTVITVKEAQ